VSWHRYMRYWRPVPFVGAGLLLFFFLTLGLAGCRGGADDAADPELGGARALGLSSGSRLHQFVLGGRGSDEHLLPQRILASPGDAVEFVTVDHRVHTVSFLRDSLSSEAWDFLVSKGQAASPPLLSRGSRFLVRLEGAPLGRYLFLSEGHGGHALGIIELRTPPAATDQGSN